MSVAKIGRPKLPKKLAKGSLLSVRFSSDERRALDRAAKRTGEKVSEWARRALLAAASEVQVAIVSSALSLQPESRSEQP